MPALLLCRGGRVIGQLTGVDRSFTAEGVAFELAQVSGAYLAIARLAMVRMAIVSLAIVSLAIVRSHSPHTFLPLPLRVRLGMLITPTPTPPLPLSRGCWTLRMGRSTSAPPGAAPPPRPTAVEEGGETAAPTTTTTGQGAGGRRGAACTRMRMTICRIESNLARPLFNTLTSSVSGRELSRVVYQAPRGSSLWQAR